MRLLLAPLIAYFIGLSLSNRVVADQPDYGIAGHLGIAGMIFAEGNWVRRNGPEVEQITFSSYLLGHMTGVSATFENGQAENYRIYLFDETAHAGYMRIRTFDRHGITGPGSERLFRAISPPSNEPNLKKETFSGPGSTFEFSCKEPDTLVINQDGKSLEYRRIKSEEDLHARYWKSGDR